MDGNNKVIIIGNNHHNTLGIVRSLGRAGMDVSCYIVDESLKYSFVAKSIYIKEFKLFTSFVQVLQHLLSYKPDNPLPVFTTSDEGAEFLDLHYDMLSNYYMLNNCNYQQGRISYWMNKEIMLAKAKECGLRVPQGFIVKINKENKLPPSDITFPCIIKPHKSSEAGKTTFRVCEDYKQYSNAIDDISDICDEVIIQEYINRDYEFLVMGMRSSRTRQVVLPGGLHKLRVCKNIKSLGMFTYAYTTGEISSPIDKDAIKRFLEAIDYDGIFSVEFMISQNEAYFLEINLRNDGTQFCFEGSGVNLPLLWIKSSFGEDISSMNKRLEKKYCMVEVNYIKNMDWHHPIVAIKEFLNTKLFALIDQIDWKPAVYKLLYAL